MHIKWVEKLANDLTTPWNIEVIIDKWNSRIGGDLNYFMEESVYNSRIILCICSENYVEKVNSRIGGAGYEGNLISSKVMTDITDENIIPLIRNNKLDEKMPRFFGNREYLDFNNDGVYIEELRRLVERIWNHDKSKIPAVAGGNPFKNDVSHEFKFEAMMQEVTNRNIEMNGVIEFDIAENDGVYNIGIGEYAFSLEWSYAGGELVYGYNDPKNIENIGHNNTLKSFPIIDDISHLFNISKRTIRVRQGEFVVYTNSWGNIAVLNMLKITNLPEKHTNVITFEYKIYD